MFFLLNMGRFYCYVSLPEGMSPGMSKNPSIFRLPLFCYKTSSPGLSCFTRRLWTHTGLGCNSHSAHVSGLGQLLLMEEIRRSPVEGFPGIFLRFLRGKFVFDAENFMDPQMSPLVFRGEHDVNCQDLTGGTSKAFQVKRNDGHISD